MKKTILATMLFMLATMAFADSQTIRLLLRELSYSQDLSVRSSIVKTLRTYVSDNTVQRDLINLVTDEREYTELRIEAAKALSRIGDDTSVKRALAQAHDQSRDIDFRAACLKSLYKAAPRDLRIRQVMEQNLRQFHDIRIKEASAFGLMKNSSDLSTRTVLLETAANNMQAPQVRVAAIKALYEGSNNSQVRERLRQIVDNSLDDSNVRVAAVRLMVTFPQGSRNRDFLENLLSRGSDTNVRSAAASTLRLQMDENDIRWLQLDVDPRTGAERNPFDQ